VHVGLEERDKIGTCLRYDEVVHVKELGNAGEG
jgi:hypothetical protein